MRTDTIFYNLFQLFPELLFELLGEDPAPAPIYEFSSREIKELTRRFDGLFIPNSDNFTDLLYFVEVQFQNKADFYWRLFTEIFAYLGQYQPRNNWQVVAIFASRSLDPGLPTSLEELRPKLRVVYLNEVARADDLPISLGIVKLVVIPPEMVREEFPRLVEKVAQIPDQALERKILDFIETVLFYKFTNLTLSSLKTLRFSKPHNLDFCFNATASTSRVFWSYVRSTDFKL